MEMEQRSVSIPELLLAVHDGTPGALDRLYAALYGDLRRLAHERLRKQYGLDRPLP